MTPGEKLAELGLTLPPVAAPVANYLPAVRSGSLVYTAGQIPFRNGKLMVAGRVPTEVSLEQAAEGAAIAALNALAAAASVAGGIDRLARIVRVCVYVNCTPEFTDQPKVANGASDLLARILGDAGKHARSAVGASGLPLGAAVEVELIAEVC